MSYQEINAGDAHEITAIDKRIAELNVEREQLLQRKQIILNRPKSHQTHANLSTAQKIYLFKKLFKGRADIFATRWQNSQGRSGYSVACSNEWVKKVCEKPRIKCNECPNREYKKLNDQAIYDHLAGKQVIGLYPLLTDNTCYLLAADFDKEGWKEAVCAMSRACLHFEIPHAIEISRSGNGAHLWIFFSESVQARDARLLGFGLLDKAMEIHPNLSFDSYDRLFPNQDIMPEGGFGNLIALPLQQQVRRQGNSLFVDLDLLPYADQWNFLSHLNTIS